MLVVAGSGRDVAVATVGNGAPSQIEYVLLAVTSTLIPATAPPAQEQYDVGPGKMLPVIVVL